MELQRGKKRFDLIKGTVGVPQGGILSPLLSNLVLHELDLFIQDLIKKRNQENGESNPSIVNPEYSALTYRIARDRKKLLKVKRCLGLKHFSLDMKKTIRSNIRLRGRVRYSSPNPKFIRFDYVRYADDWVVGL